MTVGRASGFCTIRSRRALRRPGFSLVPDPGFRVPALGFTLIEMLAVIVLIAIAATVTAMSLRGRDRGELVASAQQVAAGLRDTRTRAMATSRAQAFTVDLRAHSFAAPGREPRHLPANAAIRVASAAEDSTQEGVANIRFFPDGSSSGGRVVLSGPHYKVLVAVDWLTGAVTVDENGEQGRGSGE